MCGRSGELHSCEPFTLSGEYSLSIVLSLSFSLSLTLTLLFLKSGLQFECELKLTEIYVTATSVFVF